MDYQKDMGGWPKGIIMDKQMYKEMIAEYMKRESEYKEKIKELETELYFCFRNKKVGEHAKISKKDK